MGYLYEIATTAPTFLRPAHYDAHPPARAKEPAVIEFGPDRQQHCVLWEPDVVTHEMPVLYFHGGAYVFGEAESMEDAANAYNAQGYRFCSVGFREAPRGHAARHRGCGRSQPHHTPRPAVQAPRRPSVGNVLPAAATTFLESLE